MRQAYKDTDCYAKAQLSRKEKVYNLAKSQKRECLLSMRITVRLGCSFGITGIIRKDDSNVSEPEDA